MKWKITSKYIGTIIWVVVIVTVINIVSALMIFINSSKSNFNNAEAYFTKGFQQYIHKDLNNISVNEDGRERLNKKNLWVQILNENGKEVYSYKKPSVIKDKHTPMDMINGYKYEGGFSNENVDTILVGEKFIESTQYTYIIGFPYDTVSKTVFLYNPSLLSSGISKASVFMLTVDIIVSLVFGYTLVRRVTKPMEGIIDGIENLEEGKYEIYYQEKGILEDVNVKLNNLSDKLKSNEIERKKIQDMRQEWIANISHDIKTPLSSIKGYAELLEGDYEINDDEIKEYGRIINDKAEYIKELVDDLNLTMKLKNNKYILKKEKTNLVTLVKECIIDILNDPKYSQRDIEFINVQDVINMDVDRGLLRRSISNLIYNAIVHNKEAISIKVTIYEEEKIHIIIEDNGKGIEEEDLKYIFDRYYRGTNTTDESKGSGLGMGIAENITKCHDGTISISSKLNKGTKVEIVL